jgi:uncharacterized protein
MKKILFILILLPKITMGSELTAAIQNTNIDLAKQLIVEKKFINTQDEYGWTPLMWAAGRGEVDLCRLLLTNGAVVDVKDKDGATILEYLRGQAAGLKPEVKKQLLDLFRDASQKQKGQSITVDSTAMREQQLKDEIEMIKEGISRNGTAKINAQDDLGKTPLMEYSADGNIGACKLLLQNGAKVDIKDKKGLTAIDYACAQLKQPDKKLKNDMIVLLKSYQ